MEAKNEIREATSLLAAAFDLSFVIMQRYNRARIMKLVQKKAIAKK